MLKHKRFLWMFVIFGFHGSCVFAAVEKTDKLQQDIRVADAIVYVPLASSQSTIAFFTLHNSSRADIAITEVTSAAINKIELVPAAPVQNTKKSDAKYINMENPWLIPAGKKLFLNPKNQYLQLNGLRSSLQTGDELQLEVRLSNGKHLLVIAHAKSAFDQPHSH